VLAWSRYIAAALTVVALLVVQGCSPDTPHFVDDGASYTAADVTAVLDVVDEGSASGRPTAESAELRSSALASLRGKGAAAASAANLITRTFQKTTPGVPVYVERATFNGAPALIIVELIGPRDGKLGDKRIWVIDDAGLVLYSGTR